MINLFKPTCQESVRNDALFGICDDENGEKAYTSSLENNKWIAVIKNENQRNLVFTAIDNCSEIFKEGTEDQESTCDGMLTFSEHLYLIELKNQRKGWKAKALSQLENTIKILLEHHDLSDFKFKKAYACNREHPRFQTIETEQKLRFFKKYGFRIDIQAEIIIK